MNCAVVTPVGPGHQRFAEEARESVRRAKAFSIGPFESVEHVLIDDTAGAMGRSAARNSAVAEAAGRGVDWIFFLDADDVLLPETFERVAPFAGEHDAVWGAICEWPAGAETCRVRAHQDVPIVGVMDVLRIDPFYTLQMGHFVRTQVALATPFAVNLNAGEDFDYYLRLWLNHRCTKIALPLFINRRGRHSTGPKSATGSDWRQSVGRVMLDFVRHNKAQIRAALQAQRNASGVLQGAGE